MPSADKGSNLSPAGPTSTLLPDVDAHYLANLQSLQRLRRAFDRCTLEIDGISVKSGYFFYLFMKELRRVPSQAPGGSTLGRFRRVRPLAAVLPSGKSGILRVDDPADLYVRDASFYNKNIQLEGTSLIIAAPGLPTFVPDTHPHLGQAFSIRQTLRPSGLLDGIAVHDALVKEGIALPLARFVRHHTLYLSRLAGFATVFDRLLRDNAFSEVHLTRYVNVPLQGLLLAARRRGLQTVEHQHGVVSSIHPAVRLIDDAAPATVPDAFCTSSSTYGRLHYGTARVVVPEVDETEGIRGPAGRGILIAMQPRFAHDAVALAMRLAVDHPSISLTLRAHPRARPSADEVRAIAKIANLVLETSDVVESSLSLSGRDGHITGSSTMGLTAAMSGIPSLFLHREGFDQAEQLLGDMTYVSYAAAYGAVEQWLRQTSPASRGIVSECRS